MNSISPTPSVPMTQPIGEYLARIWKNPVAGDEIPPPLRTDKSIALTQILSVSKSFPCNESELTTIPESSLYRSQEPPESILQITREVAYIAAWLFHKKAYSDDLFRSFPHLNTLKEKITRGTDQEQNQQSWSELVRRIPKIFPLLPPELKGNGAIASSAIETETDNCFHTPIAFELLSNKAIFDIYTNGRVLSRFTPERQGELFKTVEFRVCQRR